MQNKNKNKKIKILLFPNFRHSPKGRRKEANPTIPQTIAIRLAFINNSNGNDISKPVVFQ